MEEEEATISLPSIAIVAVLGFIIYRYFFLNRDGSGSIGSSATSSSASASRAGGGVRYTSSQVDQVSAMFPQLSRRDIMWDLQRNRGNVQATTERVLMGRGLETAPQSFQPVEQQSPATNAATTAASMPSASALLRSMKIEPDLITRYNLQSRVASSLGKGKEKELDQATTASTTSTESSATSSGWASTKEQRQSILQKRRDEMILAARRKIQEKDAQSSLPASIPGAAAPMAGSQV